MTLLSCFIMIWTVISILVFICIITFFIFLTVLLPEPEYVNLEEYMDVSKWKTGDIIVLGYRHAASWILKSIVGSKWMHLSVVWIDPEDNRVYLLEGARYEINEPATFFKIPVEKWYRINRRNLLVRIPIEGKDVDPNLLYSEFSKLIGTPLSGFDHTWIRFTYIKDYVESYNFKEKKTCIEGVIRTLQTTKIFKKDKSSCSFLAKEVIRRGIECENGYSYGEPRYILPGWHARGKFI